MRRYRQDEELVVRRLLDRLAAETDDPTDAELRRAARLAAAEGRSPQERPSTRWRPWRPFRARWAAAGATALLVATGLGFAFASWLTPAASSAETEAVGLGFLPATGWTVVQTGLPGSAESARAVAANVPISAPDPQRGQPLPALHAWPPWAIVMVAKFTARGEPSRDARFPLQELPLTLADARPVVVPGVAPTEYVLRAGVGGYNVEVSINFGREPSAGMLRDADAQIARVVVAPAAVTINVRPTIYGRKGPLVVSGSVTSGKEGEKVTLQYKQCGLYPTQFRDEAEVTTHEGGGWGLETGVLANGVFRALSGGDVSNEVQVQKRVDVRLAPAPPRRFVVNVVERMQFWRKQVLIQRYHRGQRKWLLVKKLRLVNSDAAPGSVYVWSSTDEFALDVPKGTTVRAVLPLAQARPCHIGGYSNLLVTG
jgi:hypothetical protein